MRVPIVIYTVPNCPQCSMTARMMTRYGIIYDQVDLTQHPEVAEAFVKKGYATAPIVVTDTKTWSGFRLDKIKSLANFLFESKIV